MTNKDLISQYVDTGLGIPRYQFDKLSSNDKKIYLRKIYMGLNLSPENIEYYYAELSQDKQIEIVSGNGNGYAIQFIDNPSEEVKLAAVKESGHSIQFIDNPSYSIKLFAVERNGMSINHIKYPKYSVRSLAFNNL